MDTYISRSFYMWLYAVVLVIFLVFDIYRLKNASFKQKCWNRFSHFFKEKEENSLVSSTWAPIDMLIVIPLCSRPTIIAALMAGYNDPIAAIFGMRFGGKKNRTGRTWAGTIAHMVSTVVLASVALWIIGFYFPLYFLIPIAIIGAMIERYFPYPDDNIIVPLCFSFMFEMVVRFVLG
ncbi:MAG: hypothetical protein WC269_06880 [Candidatus Gracilibacteria bacterium]